MEQVNSDGREDHIGGWNDFRLELSMNEGKGGSNTWALTRWD